MGRRGQHEARRPFPSPEICRFLAIRVPVSDGLESQFVVGHDEYLRVTYREQHFRRAFAEVFRQRSLATLSSWPFCQPEA
jgi:hypothetical protein